MLSRQWISSTDKPGGGGETEEHLVNAWSEQGSWSSVLESFQINNNHNHNNNKIKIIIIVKIYKNHNVSVLETSFVFFVFF